MITVLAVIGAVSVPLWIYVAWCLCCLDPDAPRWTPRPPQKP